MLLNKLITFGIILICLGNASAWDNEGGLTEDELFDIMFNSAYMHMDENNPKWYNPIPAIDDMFASFTGYFTHTPPNMRVQVYIKKRIWTGTHYIEDTDFVDLDSSTYFQFKANASESVQVPVYKHMQEVFKNNPDEFKDFKTVDDDIEHPDILNVSVTISADGETLDFENVGYITFTDVALSELESQMASVDYGFVDSGRGSDSGGGSIYEDVELYSSGGDGSAQGMGSAFSKLFYITIPILFMLCVIKFTFGLF